MKYGIQLEFRIFYFIDLQNEENYESNFLKQLHAQVLEKMLEGKMDAHLGYEKNSVARNTLVIPVMAVMRRKFKPNLKKLPFPFPVTVTAN